MNLLIYLCILIISILCLYFANKLLGKLGLAITFITMNTISFILAFKYITLSTIHVNANAITYITMYTSLYLLIEKFGKKEAKKLINLNLMISIFTAIMLFIMSYHVQSLIDSISINMKNVFITNDRILLIFPFVTYLSNYLLLILYQKIKNLYEIPFITTVTTFLVVGLVEGILYYFLAYLDIYSIKTILELILSNYMIKLIITVIYSLILPKISQEKVIK